LRPVAASGVTRHGLSCDRAIGRPSLRWGPSCDRPVGLTSIQIRYSLFLRTGVSVLGRGPICSKAAGPSTARSRTPKSCDEEGSRSTALCTRTSLDCRRSLSHRLATLRTDQLKRHGGEPLVDLRVSPTTIPKDRTTPEGVVSWTATDSVDTPRPPDRVQTTVDTPVAQPCD
jgi:hypothetical protein